MSKLKFVFCFFSLMLLYCFSTKAQTNVTKYYHAINSAELAICDSNFHEANKYFTSAFTINPQKPFSKDLYNAFHTAMAEKEYSTAEKYIAQLLSRGMGTVFIKKNILNYYEGEDLKKIQYFLRKYPNDTIKKSPIVSKIHKMLIWDQSVRNYYYALNDGAYMVDSTYGVDYTNAKELLKLFKKYGFPNENILGSNGYEDFSPVAFPEYNTLILHNTAGAFGGRPSHLFDSILYKAYLNLDINAHDFAYLVSTNSPQNSFEYNSTVLQFPLLLRGYYFKGKTYTEYWDEASEKRINENRTKISLEPLDDFRKKIEAMNIGKNKNSVLSKYQLGSAIMVEDGENETTLQKWLSINGKDAPIKKSLSSLKFTIPTKDKFELGVLGSEYVINMTKYEDKIKYFKGINKEYYQGKITSAIAKNAKQNLFWNYHAEVIQDPKADMKNEGNRKDEARFISDYRILIEYGWTYWFGHFDNIELLFHQNNLIAFKSNVDTAFYKTITRHISPPNKVTLHKDTVFCTLDKEYRFVLTEKKYTWTKGNIECDVIVSESIDKKCRRHATATYQMKNVKEYAVYRKNVEEKEKKLDKEFAEK